jgi:hypothetical protein
MCTYGNSSHLKIFRILKVFKGMTLLTPKSCHFIIKERISVSYFQGMCALFPHLCCETYIRKKLSCCMPWRRMGERRYSSYSYLTLALNGGEWSASLPGCTLPPGKEPTVPIGQEAGWLPEPVWTQRLEDRSSTSVGD